MQYGLASRQVAATSLLVLLGLPLAALGEALRRGATSARPLQVSTASPIGAGNLARLLADLRALAGGAPRRGVSLPSLIVVVFIVAGLIAATTRRTPHQHISIFLTTDYRPLTT